MLTEVLDDDPSIQVVDCATSVEEALEKIETYGIDLILISARLKDKGALRLLTSVTSNYPDIDLLVFGVAEKKELVLQFIEAGASGYIPQTSSVDDLIASIQDAHEGKAHASPKITAGLMKRLTEVTHVLTELETGVIGDAGITPREIDVLELLEKDLTNYEIAQQLKIEVGTVKNHVHNILRKLKVGSREEAAAYLALIRSKTS
jgi:DNA-binding NarL/FixJ family response regulator